MTKIMIKANHLLCDYSDQGTELTLPASKGVILDALDRARVPYGSGEYTLFAQPNSPNFISRLLDNVAQGPSLAEMNHLAERMDLLDEQEMDKLDGILQIRNSYSIADAINATHNLGKFVQHPVFNDEELGEVAIDSGGMYEPLTKVPDELMDCLDPEKIGALVRRQDGGVFTEYGYVIQETESWDEIYDGKSLAGRSVMLEPGDPVISLLLHSDEFECGPEDGEWLRCPARPEEIDAVLKKLEVKSLDDLYVHEVNCIVPALVGAALYARDIHEVNALAGLIQARGGAELAKYKAVCEMESVEGISHATLLANRLDEYDFEPYPSTIAFGRAMLAKTGADMELMEEFGFDFGAYGWKVMDEQKTRFMPYGFVSHPRAQELTPVMEDQEQALTPEPTMGGM